MNTIEKEWQDFISFTYPNSDERSEQMRQLKACWFSAHLSCLTSTREIVAAASDEDHGVELLQAFSDEAKNFVANYVKEEFVRQSAGASC